MEERDQQQAGEIKGPDQQPNNIEEQDPEKSGRKKGKKDRRPPSKARRIIQISLLVLGIAAIVLLGRLAYVMFFDPLSAFDTTPRPSTTPANETATPGVAQTGNEPTPAATPTLSPEELLQQQADLAFMKNKVNILFLGWDQSPEREDEDSALYRDEDNNYRSDVIILLTVDFEKKTADLISIPRDTLAPIYNTSGRWKINAAFAHGGSVEGDGFLYAMNTVSDLLGVPINFYAGVDMEGLKAVVDQMGGVYYDVDVEIRLNGRVLEKGYQHLNGQQVLDYCRARKGISTDVGRADRQQRMLFAIFEQLKDNGRLVDIPNIYAAVADKVETNLNVEQIAALAVFGMSLDMENLNRHTLAGEYISNVYNGSFYVLYNSKLKELVKDLFGIDIEPDPKYDASRVKRDKAASASASYISGAEYLLSVYGGVSGASRVRSELENLRSVSAVDANTGTGASEEEIESAKTSLRSAMYSMCVSNGITKADISSSSVPGDFYSLLPDAPANNSPIYQPDYVPEPNTGNIVDPQDEWPAYQPAG